MTLTIGRLGFPDFGVLSSVSFSETASGVNLNGLFIVTSSTALREGTIAAMRGYPCPDEPVVYCTWSERPGFDGWYAVDSMDVSQSIQESAANVARLSLRLGRPRARAAPAIDVTFIALLRGNAHSIADGSQRVSWAVPSDAYDRNGPTGGTWTTRATETGTLAYYYVTVAAFSQKLAWSSPGDNYYDGASRIEQKTHDGSGSYTTLVGTDMEYQPTKWRLNNGLVRISAAAVTNYSFVIEWYDGSAWQDRNVLIYGGASFDDIEECTSCTPLRNSPEECAVRTTWRASGLSSSGRITIDLRLRRGSRTVECTLVSDVAQAWRTRLPDAEPGGGGFSTLTVATQNCGVYATGPGSDNIAPFIVSPDAQSRSTGSQYVQASSSVTSWSFGLGAAVGATPSAPDTIASEAAGYFGPVGETHQVRGR